MKYADWKRKVAQQEAKENENRINIAIYVKKDLIKILNLIKERYGIPRGRFIENAIEYYLERNHEVYKRIEL